MGSFPYGSQCEAWLGLFILAAVIGLLLFIPAGTIDYWQVWVYLSVYFTASLLITIYLMNRDPALLQRRMRGGPMAEKSGTQRGAMLILSIAFIAVMVVPSLDHRFRWSKVPVYAVIAGDVLTALFFFVMFLVFRENSFGAATIQIADEQRVVSTGPYRLVRHPMYSGALLLFLGTPLALGSWWGLLIVLVGAPALIWRLQDEEAFLRTSSRLQRVRPPCP